MDTLLPLAARCGEALKRRRETIAVAESSAGGLIAAALLAVPGASAYFIGGAVVYTKQAREALLGLTPDDLERQKIRPATEAYAKLLARAARTRFGATWAIAETGATGPTGNRYGDAAGHACVAVVGDNEKAATIETGSPDRQANMRAFAKAALELLAEQLGV
jgi:nicotinamide-nucleotide amidase